MCEAVIYIYHFVLELFNLRRQLWCSHRTNSGSQWCALPSLHIINSNL